MSSQTQRIHLLNDTEVQAIYNLPGFTKEEQNHYFGLDLSEKSEIKNLHLPSAIHFILQLGYFRAKHLLFDFTFYAVREDVKYIMARYFPGEKRPKTLPSRNCLLKNNNKILKLNNFINYSGEANETKKLIQAKLEKSVRQFNNQKVMLHELFVYAENEKFVLPGYSTLQDLVGAALTNEEKRLNECVSKQIKPRTKKLIDQLFTVDEDEPFYDLTLLKRYPKNFIAV